MKLFNFLKRIFKKKQPIKFGWTRDALDYRDVKFKIVAPHDLPPMVDLRPLCPPVYNQGEFGSCTANALGAAYQFEEIKQKKEDFIYFFIPHE